MKMAYSAKLLFQYRREDQANPLKKAKKKRLCEEIIVLVKATSADSAYDLISSFAIENERVTRYNEVLTFYYEFIGFIDFKEMMILDVRMPKNEVQEVWFDFYEKLLPMERKSELTKAKHELFEFRDSRLLPKNRIKVF